MATEKRGGGSSKPRGVAPPAVPGAGPLSLQARPALHRAVKSFIATNSNFESSVYQGQVLEDLGATTSLEALFKAALQLHIFDMGSALSFSLLLSQAASLAAELGDPPGLEPFDANAALALLAQVYDLGFEEVVASHFAEEEEESDSEDEEEEGDEAEGGEGEGVGEGSIIGSVLL